MPALRLSLPMDAPALNQKRFRETATESASDTFRQLPFCVKTLPLTRVVHVPGDGFRHIELIFVTNISFTTDCSGLKIRGSITTDIL
jgi:hypothetical protein